MNKRGKKRTPQTPIRTTIKHCQLCLLDSGMGGEFAPKLLGSSMTHGRLFHLIFWQLKCWLVWQVHFFHNFVQQVLDHPSESILLCTPESAPGHLLTHSCFHSGHSRSIANAHQRFLCDRPAIHSFRFCYSPARIPAAFNGRLHEQCMLLARDTPLHRFITNGQAVFRTPTNRKTALYLLPLSSY